MKRILSLILTALLTLSLCSMALAYTDDSVESSEDYAFVAGGTPGDYTQNTDIWVRSKAAGQIDATVPLLLVISTNINGSDSKTPTNYAVTNNSTVALKISSLTIAPQTGWTLLGSPASADRATLNAGATASNNNIAITISGKSATAAVVSPATVDLLEGGSPIPLTGGVPTNLNLSVATSKLNFVSYDDASDETQKGKGIHAVKITYTLSLDETYVDTTIVRSPITAP